MHCMLSITKLNAFYCWLQNQLFYRHAFNIDVPWYQPTTIAHLVATDEGSTTYD